MTPRNAHGRLLEQLGERVVRGTWSPGDAIPPEPLLCAEFGVSRTVVREAVKSLVAKGLVSTGPKVGTRVMPAQEWNWFDGDVVRWQSQAGLTRDFLRDLNDLRRVIEPAAARLAAERGTLRHIREIREAFDGMRVAVEEGGDYVASDLRFHQALLRASRNRMIAQMGKAIGTLLRASFEISTAREGATAASLPLHRAVLDAIAARDPRRAESAMRSLIDGADDDIERVLAGRRRVPRLPVVVS